MEPQLRCQANGTGVGPVCTSSRRVRCSLNGECSSSVKLCSIRPAKNHGISTRSSPKFGPKHTNNNPKQILRSIIDVIVYCIVLLKTTDRQHGFTGSAPGPGSRAVLRHSCGCDGSSTSERSYSPPRAVENRRKHPVLETHMVFHMELEHMDHHGPLEDYFPLQPSGFQVPC